MQTLVQHRLVTRDIRPGASAIYRLTPVREWHPPTNINSHPSETDTPLSNSHPTPPKRIQGYPSETDVDEGYTIDGNPMKEYPHSHPEGDSEKITDTYASIQAEDIYAAYPRKVGKPAAIRVIQRALKAHTAEFLLERTKLFAATY
ncbi:MAG: hypothetical protein NT154_22525, partial [Verrucomicrobia bacterium]|nr:hypothetical protein [Verrucomicrobiota bacterium]